MHADRGGSPFWNNAGTTDTFGDLPGERASVPPRVRGAMQHLVATRTVIGSGDGALVLEVRAGSVRIKRRGMPDLFVPLENAAQVGRFLLDAGA